MRRQYLGVCVALVVLGLLPGNARSQRIGVYLNPDICFFSPPALPETGHIRIVFQGDPLQFGGGEYSHVRFAVSIPPCFPYLITGAGVLGHGPVSIAQMGDGFTVPLGSCQSDEVIVASVAFLSFPGVARPSTCCAIRVIPDPTASSGMIEFTQCDGDMVYVFGGTVAVNIGTSFAGDCGVSPQWTPPSNPFPADGATQVSMDTDPGFLVHFPPALLGCPLLFGEDIAIYFGTSPNPPQVASPNLIDNVHYTFDPGSLQPATTYYWRVRYAVWGSIFSPVWSFTTETPLTTESTTWGAVKAMYR